MSAVRRVKDGFIGAANNFLKLHHENKDVKPTGSASWRTAAEELVRARTGKLTFDDNIASAEGIPIYTMSVHSAMIDVTHRRLRLTMGTVPACVRPYRAFRPPAGGLVARVSPKRAHGGGE